MNVRPASFRDLDRIEALHRDALSREAEGEGSALGSEDSPVPQSALVRLWYSVGRTLSALVPLSDTDTSLLVAEDAERTLHGFIAAQGVPGQPKAWHITNLCTAATAGGHFARGPLLEALQHEGSGHGVGRFVARVPDGSPLATVFLEQGFTQYATEQILFRDDTGPVLRDSEGGGVLRPARKDDIGAIHLLYLRTTPSHVANVEAPSQKAWAAAFLGGTMARPGRDEWRHLVAERPGVVAWAAVRPASAVRPATLGMMVDGQDGDLRNEVVDAALAELPAGPVSCVLRHYDSELIRALQRRGFSVFGTQLLLVRDLALRMRVPARRERKPVLAHAGLARMAPVLALPPHRSTIVQQRSRPSSSLR